MMWPPSSFFLKKPPSSFTSLNMHIVYYGTRILIAMPIPKSMSFSFTEPVPVCSLDLQRWCVRRSWRNITIGRMGGSWTCVPFLLDPIEVSASMGTPSPLLPESSLRLSRPHFGRSFFTLSGIRLGYKTTWNKRAHTPSGIMGDFLPSWQVLSGIKASAPLVWVPCFLWILTSASEALVFSGGLTLGSFCSM